MKVPDLKVKEFLNAMSVSEIIFVRGATEGINLVANSLCRADILMMVMK